MPPKAVRTTLTAASEPTDTQSTNEGKGNTQQAVVEVKKTAASWLKWANRYELMSIHKSEDFTSGNVGQDIEDVQFRVLVGLVRVLLVQQERHLYCSREMSR